MRASPVWGSGWIVPLGPLATAASPPPTHRSRKPATSMNQTARRSQPRSVKKALLARLLASSHDADPGTSAGQFSTALATTLLQTQLLIVVVGEAKPTNPPTRRR